jgi:hypothetical protein
MALPRSSGFATEDYAQAIQLLLVCPAESSIPRRVRCYVAEVRLERPVSQRHISPTDDTIAPQDRQRVVTELALGHRRTRFEAIRPAPEHFEPASVPSCSTRRGTCGVTTRNRNARQRTSIRRRPRAAAQLEASAAFASAGCPAQLACNRVQGTGHRRHSRQRWHCGICKLQDLNGRVGFESHPLRQTSLASLRYRRGVHGAPAAFSAAPSFVISPSISASRSRERLSSSVRAMSTSRRCVAVGGWRVSKTAIAEFTRRQSMARRTR